MPTSNLAEPDLGHPNVNPVIPVLYPNLVPTKYSGRQTIFLFLSGELTFNNIKVQEHVVLIYSEK